MVKQVWKVNPASMEFREGMTQTTQAMQKLGGGRFLMDATHLGALSEEDQQWTATQWLPEAKNAGCTKMAAVVSDDIFNKMSMEETVSLFSGIEVAVFEQSPQEAFQWVTG
mgnify:CR=1 FL=1